MQRLTAFGAAGSRPDVGTGRATRTAVFAVVSFVLAVLAHRLAGGDVSTALLGPAAGALLVAGWWATARQRSGRTIGALVVGGQLALHVGFVAAPVIAALRATGSGRPSSAALSALLFCHHAGHRISAAQVHAAASNIHLVTNVPAPSVNVGAIVVAAAPMIGLHLLAASVVAWWLARGERACWALAHRVVRGLRPAPFRPATRPASKPVIAVCSVAPRITRFYSEISRRGPPVASALLIPA